MSTREKLLKSVNVIVVMLLLMMMMSSTYTHSRRKSAKRFWAPHIHPHLSLARCHLSRHPMREEAVCAHFNIVNYYSRSFLLSAMKMSRSTFDMEKVYKFYPSDSDDVMIRAWIGIGCE